MFLLLVIAFIMQAFVGLLNGFLIVYIFNYIYKNR